MKAAFYTLGCKVNQYDTQMMTEKLVNAGYSVCSFEDIADVYIINTCTVTQISDKKSRNIISRAKRRNPDAVIVVCGCYSQVSPDDVAAMEGVDIVIGTSNRADILYYIRNFIQTKTKIIDVERRDNITNEKITCFSEKTRAILKIEDGCRNFCSYCLISFARGKIISKPIGLIHEEASALADNGYKEIVLTGIHLSSYGKDLENTDLADAITAVSKIDKIERIRLGSLEPMVITESFLKRVGDNEKLCPSFHLSLQSGCDKTLAAMNRKYTSKQYEQAVTLLRKTFPDCAVTTDVIVGFPGETDADFNESRSFVEKIGFAKVHIFPYSIRKGTKAAAMPDQINSEQKHIREKLLSETERKTRMSFMTSMLGNIYPVLVERCENGECVGVTPNYIQTRFHGDPSLCNTIVNVKITSADESSLFGTSFL